MRPGRGNIVLLLFGFSLPWLRFIFVSHPINHDLAWFYYVAQGILRGGRLYVDFIEPNTPFASLSLIPAVMMAHQFGWQPGLAVEIYCVVLGASIMAFNAAILRQSVLPFWGRGWVLAATGLVFIGLPNASFGQRESLAWIMLMPYFLLCLPRADARTAPPATWLAAGLLAALAVGLKPTLGLIPAMLEVLMLMQLGWFFWWRGAFVALLAGCCFLGGLTWLAFPLYASTIIPWALAIYGGMNEPGRTLIWCSLALCLAFILVIILAWVRPGVWRQASFVMLAGFLGALTAYYIQQKSWFYQILPAYSFLLMLAACVAGGLVPSSFSNMAGAARILGSVAVLALFYMLLRFPARDIDRPIELAKNGAALTELAKSAGPFMVFSTNVYPAFPAALIYNKIWASRYPCMLALPYLVQGMPPQKTAFWERHYRDDINADMARYHPSLVLIPTGILQALPAGFDILGWLLHDPVFARRWQAYVEMPPLNGFRLFRLKP